MIMRDNELRSYDENNTLVDLGWAFAAGTAELASSWMKGGPMSTTMQLTI